MEYFFDRVGAVRGKEKAGEQFVAITDPGSSLEGRARQLGFAHIFHGVTSIGGWYGALLIFKSSDGCGNGYRRQTLSRDHAADGASLRRGRAAGRKSGRAVGIAMGVALNRVGRDKVTIVASAGIADLGAWLEQLLAESTGKRGRGLIPLAGEPLATPECYGSDRSSPT